MINIFDLLLLLLTRVTFTLKFIYMCIYIYIYTRCSKNIRKLETSFVDFINELLTENIGQSQNT